MDETEKLLAQRGQVYGDAVLTHGRIAQVWSGIIGTEVSAYQVALCMTGLKLVRASVSPGHHDNLADAKGYVRIGEQIQEDWDAATFNEVVARNKDAKFVRLTSSDDI